MISPIVRNPYMYAAHDWACCEACGCSRPTAALTDGMCTDADWCMVEGLRRFEVLDEFAQHQQPLLDKVERRTESRAAYLVKLLDKKAHNARAQRGAVKADTCEQCDAVLQQPEGKGRPKRFCTAKCRKRFNNARARI